MSLIWEESSPLLLAKKVHSLNSEFFDPLSLRVVFQKRVNHGGAKNAELSDQLNQIRETEVMSVSWK